jgi:hypothetical protein
MDAIPNHGGSARAPLAGHNLVRLAYLDEAGTSRHETALCVAGVLVHGDRQATELHRKIEVVIERYIPEQDRVGFVFHATDIYHGSRYFDRKKWPRETREQILVDLATIIEEMELPVVCGSYLKDSFGVGILSEAERGSDDHLRVTIQACAAMDCAIWTDRWIRKFSSEENAMIIAEDTDRVKKVMKMAIQVLRTPALIKAHGLESMAFAYDLPLKHIIDTVHFAAKAEAVPLQLADLCAFILARAFKNKEVPALAFSKIWANLLWLTRYPRPVSDPMAFGEQSS